MIPVRRLIAPALQFNLSHTRGFVACAISIANAVGIDVEAVSRNPDIEVADRFFSPREVAILRAMPPERQPETFLRFWTLKEALIKATGEGLSRALDSFSFASFEQRIHRMILGPLMERAA